MRSYMRVVFDQIRSVIYYVGQSIYIKLHSVRLFGCVQFLKMIIKCSKNQTL